MSHSSFQLGGQVITAILGGWACMPWLVSRSSPLNRGSSENWSIRINRFSPRPHPSSLSAVDTLSFSDLSLPFLRPTTSSSSNALITFLSYTTLTESTVTLEDSIGALLRPFWSSSLSSSLVGWTRWTLTSKSEEWFGFTLQDSSCVSFCLYFSWSLTDRISSIVSRLPTSPLSPSTTWVPSVVSNMLPKTDPFESTDS